MPVEKGRGGASRFTVGTKQGGWGQQRLLRAEGEGEGGREGGRE